MVVDALPEDSGSRWRRWEPHIHAPGTIMASQFRGPDVWDEYLKALEAATPVIEALGITDYYCLECYERVLEAKAAGRLSRCGLIFANVETRLNFGTVKGNWTNLHLLVSPEDPEHVTEARRFLANLTYQTPGDIFRCTREELMRLGGLSGAVPNTPAALELGARQFKVTFDQLRTVYLRHEWAQQNILIAVAGGDDGTGGMRDAAEATNRKSVESFAHVIFASSVAQREFWLGKRGVSVDDLKADYNGLKPCIHGCDAHALGNVGRPDENRYTWVKGDPSFDALHQACIDPESRAYVGDAPPLGTSPSDVIASITPARCPMGNDPPHQSKPGFGRHHWCSWVGKDSSGRCHRARLRRGTIAREPAVFPLASPRVSEPELGDDEMGVRG